MDLKKLFRKHEPTLPVQERAVIRQNLLAGTWEVHIGATVPYRNHSMETCKRWCNDNNVLIRNQAELNRVLYGNMPVQEMVG